MFGTIVAFIKRNHPLFKALAERYHCSVWYFYRDYLWCRLHLKARVAEYLILELYKLSKVERKTYLCLAVSSELERGLNSTNDRYIFVDKELTNQRFASMVHRRWIPAYKLTENEIQEFLRSLGSGKNVFIKPLGGHKGVGIEKTTPEELQAVLAEKMPDIREKKCIIEEGIVQHSALSAIYPKAVNTLRVATILDKAGEAHVLGCSLRVGCGNMTVDNFSSGGIQFPIDISTGIVIGPGNRKDGSRYFAHPDTGVQVLGMKIPHYEELIAGCLACAKSIPTSRYLGWDIAVTENGYDLVEVNIKQGINGMQQDKVGKYYQLKSWI